MENLKQQNIELKAELDNMKTMMVEIKEELKELKANHCKINENCEKREQKVMSNLTTKLNNLAEIQRADSKKNHEEHNAFLRNIDEFKADIKKEYIYENFKFIKEELENLKTNVFRFADSLYTIVRENPNRF